MENAYANRLDRVVQLLLVLQRHAKMFVLNRYKYLDWPLKYLLISSIEAAHPT